MFTNESIRTEAEHLAEARRLWSYATSDREQALLYLNYITRVCALAVSSQIELRDTDRDAVYLLLSSCVYLSDVATYSE